MKTWKLKKLFQGLALITCISPITVSFAAQDEMVWGKVNDYGSLLKKFSLKQTVPVPAGLQLPHLSTNNSSINTFEFLKGQVDQEQISHARYDQYYRGLPVFGSQVIFHRAKSNTIITGSVITGIERDVTNLNGAISLEQAKKIAVGTNFVADGINSEKVIYFDADVSPKALLAYHISYLSHAANGPAIPSYIIDANNGKILQQWDALPRVESGQGFGGVSVDRLSYRPGKFQYGTSQPGVNSLGMLDIQISPTEGKCTFTNDIVRVINLKNQREKQLSFNLPFSSADEKRFNIVAFSYPCTAPLYANLNDGGFAPINDGLSPVNDVSYFVNQTIAMLMKEYKVATPVGNSLPVRIITHVGPMDNAFACGPSCLQESGINGPQQVVFGNGGKEFSPLTDGDGVAHEFAHLVTEHFSDLKYENQSGAINEAFSDITGVAILSYLRDTLGFTWFWDGKDWTTGQSIAKDGKPMRYYNNPPLDGHSIDNAANFVRGMDVHDASGVYNKMFYLLSTTPGWSVNKAYQVVLAANMDYWSPRTNYRMGGCGILQATRQKGYSEQDVQNVFQKVGVPLNSCRVTDIK